MIAGTLGLLESPADEALNSHSGMVGALDVRDTQEYLDGGVVQSGVAAAQREVTDELVHVTGSDIEVERTETSHWTHTEWVADVQTGFVLAERTAGSDPGFPWGVFRAATGRTVASAAIDTAAFIDAQDDPDVWFTGADVDGRDDVRMDYHAAASLGSTADAPNIGVGFDIPWQGTTMRGIVYASGYVALFEETAGPVQFATFVRDEVLPFAANPEDDDEQQESLPGIDAECDECGRESETIADGLCVVCRDKRDEQEKADV